MAPSVHRSPRRLHELVGAICIAGFASGDRIVVGRWSASPLGPLTDVMWARPGGERLLLVPTAGAAEFITAVYQFDRVLVAPIEARFDGRHLGLQAGDLELSITAAATGRRLPLGKARPAWVTRWIERPLARPLLGVSTYGVSPTGVREWYRADEYRPVVHASAHLNGDDLGPLRRRQPPARFGFSEPPRRASVVHVRPLLWDPSGRLDEVVSRLPAAANGVPGRRPSTPLHADEQVPPHPEPTRFHQQP